jgi:nucleotide-binding universal stress UspA family protein
MTASLYTESRDRTPTRHRARPSEKDLGRIVVGVDSSFWGLAALAWAADRARQVSADLDVCVAPTDMDTDRLVDRRIDELRATMPTRAVPVVASVHPAAALIVESRHADLVVLGCRGTHHHGLGIGATVPEVIRGAACDVVVVGGDPALRGENRQVTVLLEGPTVVGTVTAAARFAAGEDAGLRIVRSVGSSGQGGGRSEGDRGQLDAAVELAHRLEPAVPVEACVVCGEPREVVAGLADTDLVVVGGRAGLDMMARAALYHGRCPVLVVHG